MKINVDPDNPLESANQRSDHHKKSPILRLTAPKPFRRVVAQVLHEFYVCYVSAESVT